MRIFVAIMALVLVASMAAFVLSFQACDDKVSEDIIQVDDGDVLETEDEVQSPVTDVEESDVEGTDVEEEDTAAPSDATETANLYEKVQYIIFDTDGSVRYNQIVYRI
tara:strand:+ start:218 stop:541 length:324 start_codon:yes stop_codon:yes gene_type:complete